jgi:hypothetical protein
MEQPISAPLIKTEEQDEQLHYSIGSSTPVSYKHHEVYFLQDVFLLVSDLVTLACLLL